MAKKNGHLRLRIVAMLIITAALGVSLAFEKQINRALGFVKEETPPPAVTESIDLDVHFVDVGQGDACILELPDDRIMLIDAGERDGDNALINYIDEHIRRDGKKPEYFDIVMLTHSDSDHCGEMADVLEAYPAKTFYRPNVAADYNGYVDPGIAAGDLYGNYESKDTMRYKEAIEAGYAYADAVTYATDATDAEQNIIRPTGIAEGQPGYYELVLYTPTVDTYRTGASEPDWNNYSPVMILEYEGKRMALSGDAEKEAEAEFVALAQAREGEFAVFDDGFYVDLIKLGHHGSRTSTGAAYLDVITTSASCPETFAVVSCGEGNSYGHPHAETLDRLHAYGFTDDHIVRTDRIGSIVATVTADESGRYVLQVAGMTGGEVQGFAWRWLYIAGIAFAVAFILIIILPSLTRRTRKRVVREAVKRADKKR